jgi:YrbI family 3-deoxy-D-manno-octulosonate 8-phosphate phosphatase
MVPTLAFIPARGGSKGIPGKNILPFVGKPLIAHSIKHAMDAKGVTHTVVSTDDEAIAQVARSCGARVVERPAELAGDTASTESAITHALATLREQSGLTFERIVLLQATSPLRRAGEVDAALELYSRDMADSLVSVCASHDFLWTREGGPNRGKALNYDPLHRPRRQDMAPQFRENGSIYIFSGKGYEKHQCRLFGRVAIYEMPQLCSMQIDTPEDWVMLEAIAAAGQSSKNEQSNTPAAPAAKPREATPLAAVKLVVFDFDGVMSDNRVLVMQDGTEGALCNRSDGLGIGMLKNAGMPMLVLSKEQNPVVGARCRKLGLECHQGIDDKLTRLREILAQRGLAMRDVAYVGNDINDLACMREVGMPIAVADAYPQVLAVAKMVTTRAGGHGAVREVCDAILAAQGSRG